MSQLSRVRTLKRICQVLVVTLKYSFPFIFASRSSQKRPLLLRAALEELGGAWIKLGQALALRFDLLPDSYCRELFKLLNEVRPFSYEMAREVIQQELGKEPDELFQSFDREPFSAASIGQVHRGRLWSGDDVAIKIQRPGIREMVGTDIRVMYRLASVCDRLHLLGVTSTRLIVDQFAGWTEQELDYTIEARHAETLRCNQGDEGLEQNAMVYYEYTTSRVITTQFLEGVLLLDILQAVRDGEQSYLHRLASRGFNLRAIARHIIWNLLNQMYLYGYFHADLHPANLIVLSSNRIGYVDFGIVGQLSPQLRQSHVYYGSNLFRGNVERAADQFFRWVTPSANTDFAKARADLIRIIQNYLGALSAARRNAKVNVSGIELETLALVRRHHMIIDPGVVICLKALVTASSLIFELVPSFDLRREEEKFFSRMMYRWGSEMIEPSQLLETAFDYSYRFQHALEIFQTENSMPSQELTVASIRRRLKGLALLGLGAFAFLAWIARRSRFRWEYSASGLDWAVWGAAGLVAVSLALILWEIQRLPRRIRGRL